jgi:NitT/TauT family transport system substrate-binding protein
VTRWAVLALVLWVATPALAAPTHLAVGYTVSADMIALFVAQDEGMFAHHGLDVTPTALTVASVGPAGLMSGSLQMSMANPTILLNAVGGGLDLVAIAGASRHLKDSENTSLMAATGSGIRTAHDLIGKKIGIPGFGSTNDLTFRKWVKNAGVDLASMTLVEARLSDMNDLLRSHSLDAVAVLEPMRSHIVSDGTGYWVANFVTDVHEGMNGAIWIADRQWATDHREVVDAFRASLVEALAFVAANPEQSREVEIKYLKVASPMRPYLSMDITTDDLRFFDNLMVEMGALDKPVDVSRLVLP